MASTDDGTALVDFALIRAEDRLALGDLVAVRKELAHAQAMLARVSREWRQRERKLEQLAGIDVDRSLHPSYVSSAVALYGKPPNVDGLSRPQEEAS